MDWRSIISLRGCRYTVQYLLFVQKHRLCKQGCNCALISRIPSPSGKNQPYLQWPVNLSVQNSCMKYSVSSSTFILRILTTDTSICYCCSSTRNMVLLCCPIKKYAISHLNEKKTEVYSNKILRCINCRRKSRALGQARIQKGDLHSGSKIWI
jgi:hypothetical protein